MADAEEEQQAAERLAAALDALGWEAGAGAGIWARAVLDELTRHDDARQRFASDTADRQAWDRLHGSGLVLVVAIAQVLAYAQRVQQLTHDPDLAQARATFDRAGPRAKAIRDVAAHLDAYAVGEGYRQTRPDHQREPRVTEPNVRPLIFWTDRSVTYLDLGGDRINLHAAARAAVELAEVVERVRVKHVHLAGERADAALRRRYGIEPPSP